MTSLWPQIEPLLPRVQKPARYIGCEDGIGDPQWSPQNATALGLALFGARNRRPRRRPSLVVPAGALGKVGHRVRAWFSEMF